MTGGGMCAAQQPQGALVADLVENLPGHGTHMDIKPAQQAAVARDISSRGTTACLVGDAPAGYRSATRCQPARRLRVQVRVSSRE